MSSLVSVVMSVHDAGDYLAPTMESVLSQEEVDFEFVVVDDGSRDGSAGILSDYAGRDSRVRVLSQRNRGLTEALIRGCSEARGSYIARQDAADLSLPGRFALQQRALDIDPGLAFISCWCAVVDDLAQRLAGGGGGNGKPGCAVLRWWGEPGRGGGRRRAREGGRRAGVAGLVLLPALTNVIGLYLWKIARQASRGGGSGIPAGALRYGLIAFLFANAAMFPVRTKSTAIRSSCT